MKIKKVKNDVLRIIANLEMLESMSEEKKTKKEIREVIDAGLHLSMLLASRENEDIDNEVFTCVMMFYQMTDTIIKSFKSEIVNP